MSKSDFAALHRAAEPLVLFNIWDAGSAAIVADAGAKAIATGSHAVAGAQGYEDGESLPLEDLLTTVRQIAAAISLPLTVDFESGYADGLDALGENTRKLRQCGAVGCNLEDRLIHDGGLRKARDQAERIATVAEAGLFVNARTDVFLEPLTAGDDPNRPELVEIAIERGAIYREAGAGSFFIPGLSDPDMIARICADANLPVNVLRLPGMPSNSELGRLGVARISYGGAPWRDAMQALGNAARAALGS